METVPEAYASCTFFLNSKRLFFVFVFARPDFTFLYPAVNGTSTCQIEKSNQLFGSK